MEAPSPLYTEFYINTDTCTKPGEIKKSKNHELKLDKNSYLLTIELENEKINFKINNPNDRTFYYYYNSFTYDEIINLLKLPTQIYDNISKIFELYEAGLSKNKINLKEDIEEKTMTLFLKITMGFDDIESSISLKEKKISYEEMIKLLFDDISEIKNKAIPNNINDIKNIDSNEKKLEEKLNLLIEENKNNKLMAEKEKKKSEEKINSLNKKIKELEVKINTIIESNEKEKKEAELKINTLTKQNKELELKLNNLNSSINEDILNVYSFECTNSPETLEKTIYEGTDEVKIEITLKNDGEEPWPKNKTKLIYDEESYFLNEDILLKPQKPGEEEKYEIVLKNLGNLKVREYNCILSFGVGLKSLKFFGEKIFLKLNVKEEAIGKFRKEFGLSEKEFSDEKILEVLKENYFDFYKAFDKMFN